MKIPRRALVLSTGLAMLAGAASGEETVRTIRVELPEAGLSRLAVENLVGTMRISRGSSPSVVVVATVHAESAALAEAVRLERIPEGEGVMLRVRYPYAQVGTFRYREPGDRDPDWSFLDGFVSSSRYDYDGRSVRVSRAHGSHLYADLEIQMPPGDASARFRNLVGRLEAEGLRGKLRFEVASADLRLARLEGSLELDGGSGDTRAREIRGTWKSDFTSGDCRLEGFDGESLTMNATSGDFDVRSVKARRIQTRTASGDARFADADVEEFGADATSGDIELDATGSHLRAVDVATSSGDVTLRLPRDAQFDATASQSSGDMRVGFSDGAAETRRDTVAGYRRGDRGTRIRVKTSSGDFSISPM